MKKREKDKNSLPVKGSRSAITKFNSGRAETEKTGGMGFDFSYLLSAFLTVAVAVLSVGLVFYFGYHLINSFTADVTTAPAYDITEKEYRRATGYVFRSEETVKTSLSGTPEYKIADGERIGVNETVCNVYSSITDEVRARIGEIDREYELLRSSLDVGKVQTGIPEAMRDAQDQYDEIMSLLSREKYADAAAHTDSLLSTLNRLSILEHGRENAELRLSQLLAEKSGLIATYGRMTGTVKADRVGYFFRDPDGYESIFDPALLDDITVGGFAELITQPPSDVSGCVGKMIDDPKWYLCVPLDPESAQGFSEGKEYNVVFNDNGGKTLSMTLERLVLDLDDYDSDGDRGEALLIFSSKEMPKSFRYLRTQDVSIEFASYNGYRIPISAVRYYEGMTGVYTLGGGYVFFRQIKVIYEGNGYCIAADYSDAEPGKPKTYTVLGFPDRGAVDDYASLHALAEERGWERIDHDNGGAPVVKGQSLRYFYHLDDLEQIILTGKDLYHGKALD